MEADASINVGDDTAGSEYIMDDTLDPLQRLLRYYSTDFSLQRLTLVRDVADTAEFAGFSQTVKEILPLIQHFVTDQEPSVRLAFVTQIPPLARFLVTGSTFDPNAPVPSEGNNSSVSATSAAGGGNSSTSSSSSTSNNNNNTKIKITNEEGYEEVVKNLLPAAVELLADKNVEVGFAALQVMNQLSQMLKPAQVQEHLVQVTLTLAHDERAEDYRVVAAHLFNDLSPVFGKELCVSQIVPEVVALSKDSNFCVRRAVASSLSKLAEVVGQENADSSILPIFLALSKDDVWSVRKACAENLVGVSEHLAPATRTSQMIPTFKYLSEDSSRWVRVAAFQFLGRFLHTLPKADISSVLLKVFTDMAFQSESGEGELAEFCAFSFPAVLQTVGVERWREMSDAFNALIKDAQWKVRRIVAGSLHEFAVVLGPEAAEKNLVSAFELFLRDIDDIKHAVILNSDTFIKSLPTASREKILTLMCAVPPESENWRLRDVIAQKLGPIVQLVPKPLAYQCAGDLCCHLLEDSVVDVRISSYYAAAALLVHLEGTEHHNEFLDAIRSFATRPNFQLRHNYVYVLQQVFEISKGDTNKGSSLDKLLDSLPSIAQDPVSNVRFSTARVLSIAVVNFPPLGQNGKISTAVKALQADKDEEVKAKMHAYKGRSNSVFVGPRAASYRD